MYKTQEDTIRLGEEIGKIILPKLKDSLVVINLEGDLGAGKTTITKGIAAGVGVSEVVTSPSYNYWDEYDLEDGKFVHVDLWRVDRELDLKAIGITEQFVTGNLIVVEWPEILQKSGLLPEGRVEVVIEIQAVGEGREIKISGLEAI